MGAPVTMYMRVRTTDGGWAYTRAAIGSNGRVKPEYALVNGRAQHHPEGIYQLRYLRDGKRVWEPVGRDATLATVALQRRALELTESALLGEPRQKREQGIEAPAPEQEPGAKAPIKSLGEMMAVYLDEIEKHKSCKTYAAYRATLLFFADYLKGAKLSRKQFNNRAEMDALLASLDMRLEIIDRAKIIGWFTYLQKRGNDGRTRHNRATFLRTFIRWAGASWPLKHNDMPKYTLKKVRAYSELIIAQMFRHADVEEADRLAFLLGTGVREQEASHACWTDVDLDGATYNITEHLDIGFKPKDSEEGIVPLESKLIARLRARRLRCPKARLIFPGANGGVDGHLLRSIKRLALRAGVNCGDCRNQKGKSCAEHPVCRKIRLHKFRKSYATIMHEHGATARTIMGLLRHSDLETTLRYLAEQDDETTRKAASAAFGSLIPDVGDAAQQYAAT